VILCLQAVGKENKPPNVPESNSSKEEWIERVKTGEGERCLGGGIRMTGFSLKENRRMDASHCFTQQHLAPTDFNYFFSHILCRTLNQTSIYIYTEMKQINPECILGRGVTERLHGLSDQMVIFVTVIILNITFIIINLLEEKNRLKIGSK
jgi:hypothetical protein